MDNTKIIVSERFNSLLKALKLSVSDLAKSLGYSRYDKLYNISNGKNLPSFEILHDITKKFVSVNANWLLTGKGNMFNQENDESATSPCNLIKSSISEFEEIPIVDISVAAGNGYDNPDFIEVVDAIKLPQSMLHKNKKYFCVKVRGESMSPTLLDCSYLILRLLDRSEWNDIKDNHVYVVSDRDGRAYVKRIKNRFREHGFIVCTSDNVDKANYPNFNIMEDEINTMLYAEWYLSARMPNINATYYDKVNHLEDDVDALKNQMSLLLKSINITK